MIIGDKMKDYVKAKKQIDISVGESLKIMRELQELSQNELSLLTMFPVRNFSYRK